jgi:hypothetical protein
MRIMLVTSILDQHLSPIATNAAANTHFVMDIMSFSKTTMQFKQTIAWMNSLNLQHKDNAISLTVSELNSAANRRDGNLWFDSPLHEKENPRLLSPFARVLQSCRKCPSASHACLQFFFFSWMLIIPLISFYQSSNYIVSICSQIKNDLIVLPSMLVPYNCRWRWCLEVILCTSKASYFFGLEVCKPPPPPLRTTNLWALELLTSSQLCTPSSFLADPQFKTPFFDQFEAHFIPMLQLKTSRSRLRVFMSAASHIFQ